MKLKTETVVSERLTFARADDSYAFVVTDGLHVRSYEAIECKVHKTLERAICYLETKGYKILIDVY